VLRAAGDPGAEWGMGWGHSREQYSTGVDREPGVCIA